MHFKSKLLEVGKIFFILNSVQIMISIDRYTYICMLAVAFKMKVPTKVLMIISDLY